MLQRAHWNFPHLSIYHPQSIWTLQRYVKVQWWSRGNASQVSCPIWKFWNMITVLQFEHEFVCKFLKLQSSLQTHQHLKYVWNVYCVTTNHKQDLKPQKQQKTDAFHLSWNYKFSFWFSLCPKRHPPFNHIKQVSFCQSWNKFVLFQNFLFLISRI